MGSRINPCGFSRNQPGKISSYEMKVARSPAVGEMRRNDVLPSGRSQRRADPSETPSVRKFKCSGNKSMRGYVEGQNILIEWQFAKDQVQLLPELAAELV
jgi:hypothetical protein